VAVFKGAAVPIVSDQSGHYVDLPLVAAQPFAPFFPDRIGGGLIALVTVDHHTIMSMLQDQIHQVVSVHQIRVPGERGNRRSGRRRSCSLPLPGCGRTVTATHRHCRGSGSGLRSGSWGSFELCSV